MSRSGTALRRTTAHCYVACTRVRAQCWDMTTTQMIKQFRGHKGVVLDIQLDASKARLLSASQDGTARVWNFRTGAMIFSLRGHRGYASAHRCVCCPIRVCECTIVCLIFHPLAKEHVHTLKGLAYRKRVASASSPAATCKQDAALTSPARHACGCTRPSCTRFGHRSSMILSDRSKT
jgi:hypothetical protein